MKTIKNLVILLALTALVLVGCQPAAETEVETPAESAPAEEEAAEPEVLETEAVEEIEPMLTVYDSTDTASEIILSETSGSEAIEMQIEEETYYGYMLTNLIEDVNTEAEANQITFTAEDGYEVAFGLDEILDCGKCVLAIDEEAELSLIMPDFSKKAWVSDLVSFSFDIADTSIIMVDGLDREVILDSPAQTIISLAASNTEILYALGGGDLVIAHDDFSDYPPETLELPVIGSFGTYNMEEIINLQPDLVIAAGINTPDDVKALEDLGITVFYLANPLDLDGLYENLNIVAELIGHEKEAEELIVELQERVAEIEAVVASVTETPVVFYELDATDPAKPWTVGAGTYHDMLISMAKGVNLGSSLDGMYPQVSQEELIVQNPEIILLSDAIWGVTAEMVAERPGWSDITAVQNDRVLPFDGNLLDRPGPRLVEGFAELVRLLHPEVADQLP